MITLLSKGGKTEFILSGKTILFLSILLIILFIAFFKVGEANSEIIEIKSPNQCYSSLQPTSYLNKNIGSFFKVFNNTLTFRDNRNLSIITIKNTGSMRPSISDYSILIVVIPKDESEINIGDIVSSDRNILHRVINKTNMNGTIYYLTKGDNNRADDVDLKIQELGQHLEYASDCARQIDLLWQH